LSTIKKEHIGRGTELIIKRGGKKPGREKYRTKKAIKLPVQTLRSRLQGGQRKKADSKGEKKDGMGAKRGAGWGEQGPCRLCGKKGTRRYYTFVW